MPFQVDAFTDKVFSGNPAAVVPLSSWLDDLLLQAIAEENNLSETAFFVASNKGFQLRWFTPTKEIALWGHATLATAHVIFESLGYSKQVIIFETRSDELFVEKKGARLEMNFPSCPPTPCVLSETLAHGLGKRPVEVLAAASLLPNSASPKILSQVPPIVSWLRTGPTNWARTS